MSSRLIAKIHPRFAVVVHDLAMVWLTWVAINSFRWSFETEAARPGLDWFGLEVGLVLAAQGLIFWVTGLYKGLWRFASLPDLWNILRAALLGALLIALTLFIYNRLATVPRTVLVVYPEGVWYTYADREDVEEIISSHLVGGKVVERLSGNGPDGMNISPGASVGWITSVALAAPAR